MRLSKAFSLLGDLSWAIRVALPPTLRDISRKPLLLLYPAKVSRLFMSHVWAFFGGPSDENGREVKNGLIKQHAHGTVLDIGAGHGHTAYYLDKTQVTRYVALEPNTHMHDEIRKNANAAGFYEHTGTLLVLALGAEETGLITSALGGPHTVDTLVSILTLCSVPTPETIIPVLIEQILKPGGMMLYFEHVRNPRKDVAWWQWFWTPLWRLVWDGCSLDRPTNVLVEGLGVWDQQEIGWLEGEDPDHLFLHSIGQLRKARGYE
ncbi:hypothetical protein BDW22DRAFT_1363671 [Trametopsis cervina]|nr:hypothetical protein BDW22DRAFT_1363671 [Trametopsis cervina]